VKYLVINIVIWVIISTIVFLLILNVDHIVHNVLYDYGLQFSYNWANPYWFLLRTSLTLLFLGNLASVILLLHKRSKFRERPEIDYIRCPVCGKKIAKNIDICPNCNYVLMRER